MGLERSTFAEQMKPLIARLEEAMQHALPREEVQRRLVEGERLAVEWADEKISETDYIERSHDAVDVPCAVMFDSLAAFSFCLRQLLPEDRAQAVLSHENAHMSRIEFYKLKGYYRIVFAKNGDGEIGLFAAAGFEHPEGMSFEEISRIDTDVTSAPDDLSEGDVQALKILREAKKSNR